MNPDEKSERFVVHDELPEDISDPFIRWLHKAIKVSVKILAVLMVLVIFWSVFDVIYVIYDRLMTPPFFLLILEDILVVFGAILAVLIGIEIFINIRLYLGTNVIPVQLVLATALMAVARKIIVLDLEYITAELVVGLALVTMALGVSYWLIAKRL